MKHPPLKKVPTTECLSEKHPKSSTTKNLSYSNTQLLSYYSTMYGLIHELTSDSAESLKHCYDEVSKQLIPKSSSVVCYKLFTLARVKLLIEKRLNRSMHASEVFEMFCSWHGVASVYGLLDPTKNRDYYWTMFKDAMLKAKQPIGDNALIQTAWESVATSPIPEVARGYECYKKQMLVSLCHQMQLRSDGDWFIPSRVAAELLDLDKNTVCMYFNSLVYDKILAKTQAMSAHKCPRYMYLPLPFGETLQDAAIEPGLAGGNGYHLNGAE